MLIRIRKSFKGISFDKFLFFNASDGAARTFTTKLDVGLYVNSVQQIPDLLKSLSKDNNVWWAKKERDGCLFEFHGELLRGSINFNDKYPTISNYRFHEIGVNIANTSKQKPFIDKDGTVKSNLLYGNIEIKYKVPCSDNPDKYFAINVHIIQNQKEKLREDIKTDFMGLVWQEFKRLTKPYDSSYMDCCIEGMHDITLMSVYRSLQRSEQSSIVVYPRSIEEGAVDNLQDIGAIINLQNEQKRRANEGLRHERLRARFYVPTALNLDNMFSCLEVECSPLSPTSPGA